MLIGHEFLIQEKIYFHKYILDVLFIIKWMKLNGFKSITFQKSKKV